jgi:hypothetical protein
VCNCQELELDHDCGPDICGSRSRDLSNGCGQRAYPGFLVDFNTALYIYSIKFWNIDFKTVLDIYSVHIDSWNIDLKTALNNYSIDIKY